MFIRDFDTWDTILFVLAAILLINLARLTETYLERSVTWVSHVGTSTT